MLSSAQVITSLAVLTVNWDNGKSYLDNFVPFTAQCIKSLNPQMITVNDVQNKLKDDFGFDVPQNTIKSILKLTTKRGYTKLSNKAYLPVKTQLDKLTFDSTRQQMVTYHDTLLQKFTEFSFQKYERKLTNDEAEKLLFSYLRQNYLDIIFLTKNSYFNNVDPLKNNENIIICSFIKSLFKGDPNGLNYLEKVVKGYALSTALLFPDISKIQQKFVGTSFYIDTPILLRALGHEGKAYETPSAS